MTLKTSLKRIGTPLAVLPLLFATPAFAQKITLQKTAPQTATTIDFGTNASEWANDGECDDPRFEGEGSAAELVEKDRMRDAADCSALFNAGRITLRPTRLTKAFDFGDDTSQWANDGECDDPRFEGEGAATILLEEDMGHDASDCRTLFQTGQVTLSPGGGPDRIDFGDNASQWANDGECDDSRFDGTGMSETFVDEDIKHDANDCSTLFFEDKIDLAN